MLHAHRLAAVRICLLIVGFALLSATSALATSTHRFPTVSASRLHDTSHAVPASEAHPQGGKSSPSRRARCVAIVTRAGKRRKVVVPCAVKKPKATGAKPSVRTSTDGSAADSAAPVGAQIAVIGGAPPTEALDLPGALDVPGSEPGPAAEASVTEKQSTTTTLASSLNPSMVGQAVTYTATVNATMATGSVTFEEAGTAISGCAEQIVSLGAATCTLSGYASASTHSITATYNGDGNYIGSKASVLSEVVSRASTGTTLTSSANPSMVGQPVIYTARVSPAAGTGTVSFDEAGTPIASCTAQPVSSGTATCATSGYTTPGEQTITATYSGDGNYRTSTSPSSKHAVDKTGASTSTTALSSSSNPSTFGEAVTYTATVSPAAATGTVEFKQAGVAISGCSAQAVRSGTATCTVTNLAAGGHWTAAVYSGDSNYIASPSPGLTQIVNKQTTTTAAASSLDPSTVGEAITYKATVSPSAATGTIEFKQAGVPISGCSAQAIRSGMATCTVTDLDAGGHGITAVYTGGSNYTASSSPGLTQTVNKKITTTTASSSLDPSTAGEAVTYTATVSPAAATGTVEFKQGGVAISGCSAQAVSSGTATCTVADLAVGWQGITAVYSGDSSYAASWSPGMTQTVNKQTTTTTASSSSNPSTVGQAVTYTATVRPVTATGTVEFEEEGTPIKGCSAVIISSGAAKCTVSDYPKWSSYTITATYTGDTNDMASASSTFTQTVEPPAGSAAPFRFFSPTGFWNKEVSANAPLDSSSAEVVGALNAEVAEELEAEKGPAINTTAFSVPVYTVPAEQPMVKVRLESASENPTLQAAWEAVPLPPNAQPAVGGDKHLVVWQPSTNKLWEFWHLEKTEVGWEAAWGGAIEHASSDSGAYGPEAWPGATTGWGASGSSLSMPGGLITLEDLERGEINHALAMAVPNTRAGVYASPAQRTDGSSIALGSLPEGAHLRLDPSLDLASLHLPRLTLMMAEAAQRYGIFIRDTASNVAFYAQDPIPTGTEPYTGPHGYFDGKSPGHLLTSFPWSHLQLLKMELHSTS
jgi:hypothetical protein